MPEIYLLTCADCGAAFFTPGEKAYYQNMGLTLPKRCGKCRAIRKRAWEEAHRAAEREEKERQFAEALATTAYTVVDIASIRISSPDMTLYVIGNGFDLMHGVPSAYSDFRDSMGKRSELREALETYIQADDLWWNFEEALAHLDTTAMAYAVEDGLSLYNAYDADAQVADYYLAIDMGMAPADTITEQLPKRFRRWVETLRLPNDHKALGGLIAADAKCMVFNYTEFVETLYGAKDVCYLHGSRKRKGDKLILGHSYSAEVPNPDWKPPKYKDKFKRSMLEAALDDAAEHVSWYDDETTKNSLAIIEAHREFFEGLHAIDTVVVIGHSLSEVDWDYFKETIKQNADAASMQWIIGCHSAADLERIDRFASAMGIRAEQITVFRT